MGFQDFLDEKEGRGRPPARADHEGKGQAYTPQPLSMKPGFMKVEDAIRIVLDLANQNTLTDEHTKGDPDLVLEMEKQQVAIGVIEDFFCNVVAEDRLVDLKEVLMKMGNILVMQHGWDPSYKTIREDVARSVMRVDLDGPPSTDLITAFTEFMNLAPTAREALKDLGFSWSMPS